MTQKNGSIQFSIDKSRNYNDLNKKSFDAICDLKEDIEKEFGDILEWQRDRETTEFLRVRKDLFYSKL